ncbi:MAG TPA: hypothetical protein VL354_07815 [Spirochaetia bacterium]|nr:hypothetical protein [Spirochaetia bacterium]
MGKKREAAVGLLEPDTQLREQLLAMAARKSRVVHNGRFLYSKDLNALTYWYEDHTHSTRMVYIESDR